MWELPGAALSFGGIIVVETAQELRDRGDAEKIVCVSEETHPCYHDRSEVAPLGLGIVEGAKDG